MSSIVTEKEVFIKSDYNNIIYIDQTRSVQLAGSRTTNISNLPYLMVENLRLNKT